MYNEKGWFIMKSKVIVAITLLFVVCVYSSQPPIYADTNHCGTISSNETWSTIGNVHVVTCNVIVASGVTLTLESGVIVKFTSFSSIIVQGTIRILGTSGAPVYLTSIHDDTVGGDTNGNGGATNPNPGDWPRIEFQDSSSDANSLIDHAEIRYAGRDGYGAITFVDASPTVQNTTITDNSAYALLANLKSFPVLSNLTMTDNGGNALAVQGGSITSNTTWDMTETVYYLLGNVSIVPGVTLTIEPNVIVKFTSFGSLIVQGTLRVLGTTNERVYFTSPYDDTLGGDSNGNGATNPNPGDWLRIEFQDSSSDANSLIDHAEIRYAGRDGYGAITFVDASPTVQNTTITDSAAHALYTDNSTPSLSCNDILDSGSYGLYNETPNVVVNAENQWWGHASGPYASSNPSGTGDAVTDGVDFTPWLTVPCNSTSYQIFLPLVIR